MNIIDAIINLVENPITEIKNHYGNKNRANNMGDALEEFIKDLFSNTFNINDEKERIEKWSKVFSYLGNNSNPPDIMLRDGDAIEVKKIESYTSSLALNSSYPKNKLYRESKMITDACRKAEVWTEKDMIYSVGVVKNEKLKHLCFVYGDDYAASTEVYEGIKNTIKYGIETIPNIDFSQTKELGRVNKVDPLGITYLRIRGMWGIENPWKVFSYIYKEDTSKEFNFMCIINEEKWNSFNNVSLLLNLNIDGLNICDVKIKNPNNPANLKKAKLITYSK